MASCRVRRGSVYVPIAENFAGIVPANRNSGPRNERVSFQEGTDGADGVTAGPRPSSLDAPLPVAQPSSRRQSGTLSSFFSGNSTAQGDRNSQINTTPQPTASRRNRSGTAPSAVDSPLAAGPTAANTGSLPRRRARRGSTLVPTDDAREGSGRPQSWVNDHIMGGRSRRGSAAVRPSVADARLLDTRDGDARGRSASILSEGGAGVEVSLAMDEENRTSRFAEAINASRSPPRSPSPAGRSEASFVDDEHHLDEVVDHLDVIDPQIAVVSHLSNAANSILIPSIPMLYSRKPVVTLPTLTPSDSSDGLDTEKGVKPTQDQLDMHFEHVLKRREKFRRTMRGVWDFIKTPIGIITAIYGFLVAFWGAAIVIFLVKIINLHNPYQQKLWIEITSQVENGLFTLTGVGLIPWRARDTYRIYWIWYYKRLTHKLRKKQGLPQLQNEDDLPDPAYDPNYVHVLTDRQQGILHYQQIKFMESQTWYRPHATDTHRAFPINTALLICCLIDGNSFFQCILCGTMWGLNRFNRPAWTTGILIPASFLCGIFSAVFIARGGAKTKKVKEVEEMLRGAMEKDRTGGVVGLGDYPDQPILSPPVLEELDDVGSEKKLKIPEEALSPNGETIAPGDKVDADAQEPVQTITTFGGPVGHIL